VGGVPQKNPGAKEKEVVRMDGQIYEWFTEDTC
jgi:hypothetical protein